MEPTCLKDVWNVPANEEAQSSPAGDDLLPVFRSHAEAKLAAFSKPGQHEADGTSFERDAEFCDAELLALALRSRLRSGIDPSELINVLRISLGSQRLAKASLAHSRSHVRLVVRVRLSRL
jgi:hypothetical protein